MPLKPDKELDDWWEQYGNGKTRTGQSSCLEYLETQYVTAKCFTCGGKGKTHWPGDDEDIDYCIECGGSGKVEIERG